MHLNAYFVHNIITSPARFAIYLQTHTHTLRENPHTMREKNAPKSKAACAACANAPITKLISLSHKHAKKQQVNLCCVVRRCRYAYESAAAHSTANFFYCFCEHASLGIVNYNNNIQESVRAIVVFFHCIENEKKKHVERNYINCTFF